MAGFVDGEGNITIVRQTRKDRPSPAYHAYVRIDNTDPKALPIFVKFYGGRINLKKEKRRALLGNKWADAYTWQCPVSTTKGMLLDLLPYLRLKNRQAEIVLRFIDKKSAFARGKRKGRRGSSPLTAKEIEFRERLRREVRLLNRKGKFARMQGGG